VALTQTLLLIQLTHLSHPDLVKGQASSLEEEEGWVRVCRRQAFPKVIDQMLWISRVISFFTFRETNMSNWMTF
jgi:hypothetical protein